MNLQRWWRVCFRVWFYQMRHKDDHSAFPSQDPILTKFWLSLLLGTNTHQIRIALCLLRRNTNFTEKPNTLVTSQLFKLFNNPRKKYIHQAKILRNKMLELVMLSVTCWDILTDDPGKGGGDCHSGADLSWPATAAIMGIWRLQRWHPWESQFVLSIHNVS